MKRSSHEAKSSHGRAERLAAALRENLRRRKAQQRQRDAGKAEAQPDAGRKER